LQVQYAFLELPKVPSLRPDAVASSKGADLWAWLFVHATELTEVPVDLSPGPYRKALELANQATFTQEELQTYERVRDEIRQVLEIAAARFAEGHTSGETAGKIAAILAFLAARGISVSAEARTRIEACREVATLDRWIVRAATASSVEEVIGAPAERA
jgi:hypothetical protein